MVRRATANSIGCPSTSTVVGVPNVRLPLAIAVGPMAANALTAGLLGKACCSCWIPFGVGVRKGADEEGAVPVRVCSKLPEPKNHNLSFRIGPPTVPPHRLSPYRGTEGGVQPSAGLSPTVQ